MLRLFVLSFLALLTLGMTVNFETDSLTTCLPDDVKPEMVVALESPPETTTAKPKPVTVKQRLWQLKAHCKDGKLLDGQGKEIRFVHLIGCWGNPPADYQEQLDRQQKEVKELSEKYTVIQIPCSQSKDPTKIH